VPVPKEHESILKSGGGDATTQINDEDIKVEGVDGVERCMKMLGFAD
jgi:hypothetical protein